MLFELAYPAQILRFLGSAFPARIPGLGAVIWALGPFSGHNFGGSFLMFFFRFFALKICNAGICLEGVCEGCCQVSPAGGWCAWPARPYLGFRV